jgi:hypothetical protein
MLRIFQIVVLVSVLITPPQLASGFPTSIIKNEESENMTSTVLVIAITGAATLVGAVGYLSSALTKETKSSEQQAYLKQNQLEIIEALATGQGQFIDDLTFALEIPRDKVGTFTHRLTARYDELIEFVGTDQITPLRAKTFFNIIVKLRAQI